MVTISNFSSVFEITFAVNGLMYFFDVLPRVRDDYNAAMKEYVQAENRNYDAGFKSYCNWGEAISFMVIEGVLRRCNVGVSLLSLVLLLSGAYFPAMQMWTWLMTVLVCVMFAVPGLSFVVLHGECKALRELTVQRNRDYEMGGLVEDEKPVHPR